MRHRGTRLPYLSSLVVGACLQAIPCHFPSLASKLLHPLSATSYYRLRNKKPAPDKREQVSKSIKWKLPD